MGMYTAFKINVTLKEDLPAEAWGMLNWMASDDESDDPAPPVAIPDLPFFSTHRWQSLLIGRGGYFEWPDAPAGVQTGLSQNPDGTWQIISVADTKGSPQDLAQFFDWLLPWIAPSDAPFQFIGEALYEDSSRRWVAFLHDGRLFYAAEVELPDPQPEIGFYGTGGFYDSFDARHDFVETWALDSDGLDLPKMVANAHIYPNRLA